MVSHSHASVTHLKGGETLRIRDGCGQVVSVFDGLLWLTQENDGRDLFLSRGESFTLDRDGLALVHAFRSTHLGVTAATLSC